MTPPFPHPATTPPWLAAERRPVALPPAGLPFPCWVGGYLASQQDGAAPFEQLLVGVWERRGLRFIGCVGEDWPLEMKRELFDIIKDLPLTVSPFYNVTCASPASENERGAWLFPSHRLLVQQSDLQPVRESDSDPSWSKVA